MRLQVIDHPLVAHKLTVLREKKTPSPVFRQLVDELMTLLAYEATRDINVETIEIETPVAKTTGTALTDPPPIVVPILRAGLGMLAGMQSILPTAEVGFLGMKRDEKTLEAITYANRLPDDLANRQCYVLDPMLATGHTLIASIDYLLERGAKDVTAICLLGAPTRVSPPWRSTLTTEPTSPLSLRLWTRSSNENVHHARLGRCWRSSLRRYQTKRNP